LDILLLLIGFVLLIVGADKLVDGASSISRNLKIPNIVIGLTIVAFGTSAPELVVNAFSSYEGHNALVMGNVLGSNIFNIAVILGLTAIFRPLVVKRNTTWLEIPFNLLAITVVALICLDISLGAHNENMITKSDALVLLAFFIIFLVYNIELSLKGEEEIEIEGSEKSMSNAKGMLLLAFGLVGLIVGGKLIVDSAVNIASTFGMSERLIGLTIVSIGTSLPELATSIVAVRKGKVDIAVGNVIGSNIFNIFFVLGISGLINNIPVPNNSFMDIHVNIALGILLMLFVFIGKGRKIVRIEGIFLLLIYLCYMGYLILYA